MLGPHRLYGGQWRPTAVSNILHKLYWNEKPRLSSLRPSSSWLGADDRTSSGWSQPSKRRLFWAWRWEGQKSGELRRTQRGSQAAREGWVILRLRGETHGGVEPIQGPQHGGISSLVMSFLTGLLTSFKRHFLCQQHLPLPDSVAYSLPSVRCSARPPSWAYKEGYISLLGLSRIPVKCWK